MQYLTEALSQTKRRSPFTVEAEKSRLEGDVLGEEASWPVEVATNDNKHQVARSTI